MPFVPAENVVEARMKYYAPESQITMNTLHFQGTAAWTTVSLAALALSLSNWESDVTAGGCTCRQQFCSLFEIDLRDLTTESGLTSQSSYAIFGRNTGGPLPNNVTLCYKIATGQAGRDKRGRIYFIGISETMLDIDANNQAVTVAYQNFALPIMNRLVTGSGLAYPNGAKLGVLSRYHGKLPNGNPAPRAAGQFTPATGIVLVDRFLDSQRRRLINHNRHR